MVKKSKEKTVKKTSSSVEEKLRALHQLQIIDSEIDKIRIVRGELPLEIQDLEDLVEGLNTRLEKSSQELSSIEEKRLMYKNTIKEAKSLITKYNKQLENIKNNREFTSLTKEIEYQTLEIELAEKKIKEVDAQILMKKELIDITEGQIQERSGELKLKKEELNEIIKETEKEEQALLKKSTKAQKVIEERLLTGYSKIREKVKNGLAVVSVDRDACGGCFNKIPPQRQLDIQLHKKVIVCEHCGRILVDADMLN